MELLDKVHEIINDVIWPLFGLIALLIFRMPIAGMFGRLASIKAEAGKYRLSASLQDKFPAETIEQISKNPGIVNFSGESRRITAVYAYTRGYTDIYEQLDPQSATRYVQIFIRTMQEIVFEHGGTIERYDGARMIAYWGAPIAREDDAVRACVAALEMKEAVRRLSPELELQGLPKLNAEFALTTADVMVGDFGTGRRKDYSLLGDYLYTLERIAELNSNYHSNIIVTQYTYADTASIFVFEKLAEQLKVKGKSEPVTVYELHGKK